MRRIIFVLAVAVLMAVMLTLLAVAALAQPVPDEAVCAWERAESHAPPQADLKIPGPLPKAPFCPDSEPVP